MKTEGRFDAFLSLLAHGTKGMPFRISRDMAREVMDPDDLEWFRGRDIISALPDDHYKLVDEFLRVRVIMDFDTRGDEIEQRFLEEGELEDEDDDLSLDA